MTWQQTVIIIYLAFILIVGLYRDGLQYGRGKETAGWTACSVGMTLLISLGLGYVLWSGGFFE